MKFFYITFRSVTYAQHGEKVLQEQGIRCTLQRTPRWMEAQGCGYCLRIWTENVEAAMFLLKKARVPLRKVYRQRSDGLLEELEV